jgi:hypothetical protein
MCLFNLKVPRHAVAAWPYILHVCFYQNSPHLNLLFILLAPGVVLVLLAGSLASNCLSNL